MNTQFNKLVQIKKTICLKGRKSKNVSQARLGKKRKMKNQTQNLKNDHQVTFVKKKNM